MTTGDRLPDDARIVREAQARGAASILYAIGSFFAMIGKGVLKWRARQREMARLRTLNDRILHDVGLTRTELLYGSAPDRPTSAANRNDQEKSAA